MLYVNMSSSSIVAHSAAEHIDLKCEDGWKRIDRISERKNIQKRQRKMERKGGQYGGRVDIFHTLQPRMVIKFSALFS